MAIDTSMYQGVERPDAGNLLQAYATAAQASNARAQNALLQMQTQQAQQQLNDSQALRTAYAGAIDPTTGQIDYGKMYGSLAQAGAGNQIPGVAKSQMEMRQMQIDQATKALGLQKQLATQVMAAPTQANAQASLDQMEGLLGKGSMAAERQRVAAMGDDQVQLKAWAAGHAMDADKLLPQFQKIDTGGAVQTGAVNPVTGQFTQAGSIDKTVSPDSIYNQGQENKRAQKANDIKLQVAGIYSGGGVSGDGSNPYGPIVDQIGQYKGDEKTLLARMAPAVRAQILQQIQEKYPDYDSTFFSQKKNAATYFGIGQGGNAMRSVSTANAHLDQLGQLADALNNGDVQIANKIANAYATSIGKPQANNFNAIKNIVGQEVVKAIIAGGGSAGERDEAATAFNSASSPQQLHDVIAHYRQVMQAQYDNLLAQRRGAGLPDSTLPDYNSSHGGSQPAPAAHPADIQDLLKKYGGGK